MRVATPHSQYDHYNYPYFNPRHPCGWRLQWVRLSHHFRQFQSTPPMRVATKNKGMPKHTFKISIHATHAGGDRHGCYTRTWWFNFNPRHPCGWRRCTRSVAVTGTTFQSTPPMRVATGLTGNPAVRRSISIHATHAGGDVAPVVLPKRALYFNPRHPCGWRRGTQSHVGCPSIFQSTPPMRVATVYISLSITRTQISIHATHAGGDYTVIYSLAAKIISIHATHAGGDEESANEELKKL